MKMKKYVMLVFAAVLLLGVQNLFAENKTEEFKVYGNCDMCKKRVETAARLVQGVASVDWNKETKMMTVVFDAAKTDVQKVEMTIAMFGHDTQTQKASDEAYNKLPSCCKYDRATSFAPAKAPAMGKMKMDEYQGHMH